MKRLARRTTIAAGIVAVAAGSGAALGVHADSTAGGGASHRHSPTATPIRHVVVIFQENVSFDHYFATYPVAANIDGSYFQAGDDTPSVNGLSGPLLTNNPSGVNPFRLSHSQALTCDQDHDYTPEQQALDRGVVDMYPEYTQVSSCSAPDTAPPNLVMGYYDGNTVTALWNYAQHFSMSDNSYDTVFGPSTPGALNLVSGQTHGATPAELPGVVDQGTVYGDADPTYDDCSAGTTVAMSGTNIGDLLNARGVTWGWFEGGFAPTGAANGKAVCGSSHQNVGGATVTDYSAHHEPFQYYASTANPHHLPPANEAEIGHDGQANHQYDLSLFYTAVQDRDLPSVSFLKAPRYEDGHAGYSDPLDEQTFLVDTINAIEKSPYWDDTAVIINYDDSDGWYDHVMPPIVNASRSSEDALQAPGECGNGTPLAGYQVRCGHGPRLPLLVISPYSRVNYVDHSITDQTSILRFIEDNWRLGQVGNGSFDSEGGSLAPFFDFDDGPRAEALILNPQTGEVVHR